MVRTHLSASRRRTTRAYGELRPRSVAGVTGTTSVGRPAPTGRAIESFREVQQDAEARGEELRFS